MAITVEKARRIAAQFGVSAQNIKQPSHAFLTTVFLIDNAWVLRGRPIVGDTFERFDRECRLLDKARTLIPYAIPNPIRVPEKEERYVSDGINLWTMYAMIPGEIRGTWQKVNEIPDQEVQKLLGALGHLHSTTKNLLSGQADDWFVRETQRLFQQALDVWSSQEQRVLNSCFS